jgi:hypothetical protein
VQMKKAHERSHHGHTGNHPAFPAQWFYGLLRALPGDQALLSPSPALLLADLTPTLGRQTVHRFLRRVCGTPFLLIQKGLLKHFFRSLQIGKRGLYLRLNFRTASDSFFGMQNRPNNQSPANIPLPNHLPAPWTIRRCFTLASTMSN